MDSSGLWSMAAGIAEGPRGVRFDLRRDLVATADGTGRFTSLNRAWERVLGWTREELMARPIVEFVHPEDIEPTVHTLVRLPEADLEVVEFRNRLRRRDGTYASLLWNGRTDGTTWVAVAVDVTEERIAEARIASAIEEDRLLVYSQPIIDRRSGEAVQEELLVRLRERGKIIGPDGFLPEAERSGAIVEVDRFMVDRAFELAAAGRRVAVNLSPRTIEDDELIAELAELVATRTPESGPISFEITETAVLATVPHTQALGRQLEGLASELALDDFGTGSASFLHLRDLPIDAVKIDRRFVAALKSSATDRAICRAIAGVARELGLTTVAEGVEDEATLGEVEALEIDRVQGFLFAAPAPV